MKVSINHPRESIALIEKYIPEYKYKKIFQGKLYILKGFLQWVENKTSSDAFKNMLMAFDNVDDMEKDLLGKYLNVIFYHIYI
jgi:hypothetical protein